MNDFTFRSPTEFVFGKNATESIGEKLASLGAHRVLVHYGSGSAVRSGLVGRVDATLDSAGLAHVTLGGVRPNPEVTMVREGVELARNNDVDFILAVGGGSVIDSAKAIAAGVPFVGDVWELFTKHNGVAVNRITEALPVGCVLTIPAAGSEASDSVVISNDELGLKTGQKSDLIRCRVAFMDPQLTFTLPAYQTAAGATDMLAHLMERFFSAGDAVPVTDNLNLSLMRTIVDAAPKVLAQPENYEARADLMWAGMLAHNGLAGLGLSGDWASHALEHELSALNPAITHGAGLAVVFPAWLMYCLSENPSRIAQMGSAVFDLPTSADTTANAQATIAALRSWLDSLGMPAHLAEFDITEADIERMIPTLIVNKGEAFGGFKVLHADDARTIYRLAL